MTDVFLSYKREDKAKARAVAEALARRGLDVWWDVDLLPGDRFADEIEAVIKRVKVAVVLWSSLSITSDYVRDEARLAKDRGILLPARIDGCEPPLGFRGLHTDDLSAWSGEADSAMLEPLVEAAANRAGVPHAVASPAEAGAQLRSNDDEAKYWETVRTREPQSTAEYRLYLKRYPNGLFVDIALSRIAELSRPKRPSPMKLVAGATAVVALVGGLFGAVAKWPEVEAVLVGWGVISASIRGPEPEEVADEFAAFDVFRDTLANGSDCAFCPEMVVIPRGTFTMGSPADEAARWDAEGPQRSVTVERFAIGRYEVTFAEYDACAAADGCARRPSDSDWGRGQRPVIDVSWDDAQAYVTWLSRTTAQPYRLPSEAEWEFAASAGSPTRFAFGNEITPTQANFAGNVGRTWEVGSGDANAWGLFDMHGNVWEWVQDCWHSNYTGAPSDGSAWLDGRGGDCSRRVARGGSWIDSAEVLRSAARLKNERGLRGDALGFRVARTLTP